MPVALPTTLNPLQINLHLERLIIEDMRVIISTLTFFFLKIDHRQNIQKRRVLIFQNL
jgi:hypothetical protein